MKRAAILVVVALLLVLGIGIAYLVTNLDALVERAIETYGSQATGTRVSVGSVDIGLREGRGTIRDVAIGNLEGFDAENIMVWEEVTVDIDTGSVGGQPYVLDAVVVAAPEVVFEVDERGRANLRVLQERLAKDGGGADGEQAPAGEQPRLRIRAFAFERGVVEAHVADEDVRAELPPLTLRDLGGAGGATAGELARALLRAYTQQVLRTVAKRQLDREARKLIDEELGEGAAEGAKKLLDRVLDR